MYTVTFGLKTSLHAMHILMNTMARKLSFIKPTPKIRALFQHILHFALIIIIIVVHVVKHQSVLINTVRVLAIASLFFRVFYATLHAMFQRLSCLPCVSYSALASPKSALAFQSLSCISKALLRFTGLLAVMRASLFKVKA